MMIDRADRLLASWDAWTAEANAFLDDYILFVRQRDGLGGTPIPNLRQTHIDGRSGLALNWRRALELAKADLGGERAPPANTAPSAPHLRLPFDPEITGVGGDISVRQAVQKLKVQRHAR
jgi:hypothetical protein